MRENFPRIQWTSRFTFTGLILILCGLALFLLQPAAAHAQSAITATNNRATLKFPESVTFSVDLKSDSAVTQVTLEYGVEKLTCGGVSSTAIAKFTPNKNATADWNWDMRQTGSEPPGAKLWWRWRAVNADGKEVLSERLTIPWLDSQHSWQTAKGERAILHWYTGDITFASTLSAAADKSLIDLERTTGLKSDGMPPDIYIYGSSQEMRDAIFFAPSWTGGRAYADYNIVIIGIAPNEIDWGKTSIAHELTHVLDGRSPFSCLNNRPTWLTEGLAMFGEGGPDASSLNLFKTGIVEDRLISVRSLSAGFPEARDRVDLSYTESYSLVNFLIGEYGKDKLNALRSTLKDGAAIDSALRAIYGFDTEGFEDAWRAKIGAKPRSGAGQAPAAAAPTVIPTAALVAGFQFPTRTPTLAPTTLIAAVIPEAASTSAISTPVVISAPSAPDPSGASPWNALALLIGVVGLLVVGAIARVIAKRQKEK